MQFRRTQGLCKHFRSIEAFDGMALDVSNMTAKTLTDNYFYIGFTDAVHDSQLRCDGMLDFVGTPVLESAPYRALH